MAAQYDLKKSVRPKGKEDETVLYPKVVPYGTKTLKNFMKNASKYTGLNPSTVQGVVTFLEDMMAEYLANGYNVKLGNIGTFSASLTSRKVTDKKEIRANSIHFDNVHFKAAKELKNSIDRQMKLERVAPTVHSRLHPRNILPKNASYCSRHIWISMDSSPVPNTPN